MRGGKREGAGRKREVGTVIFPIRTTAHTREALKEIAKTKGRGGRPIAVGEMLIRLVFDKEYRENFDRAPD